MTWAVDAGRVRPAFETELARDHGETVTAQHVPRDLRVVAISKLLQDGNAACRLGGTFARLAMKNPRMGFQVLNEFNHCFLQNGPRSAPIGPAEIALAMPR